LAEKLLFQSGSYQVDKRGKEALGKLASVLKQQKEFEIVVEGHTDDVPMRSGATLQDNWDLSVMRATSITRILANAGIDPSRIIASGRSEYIPKVEGETPEARQKNRRTEIIISPKLDELYRILESN
jgi:chemotaxis protein MotB